MWHEARKHEKKIRGMMVDHKKRAERRRQHYERIKLDPTQFLQLHGRRVKIHTDPSVSAAAEGPGSMLTWQGDPSVLIDRFDVRAHLDVILDTENFVKEAITRETRDLNYERYRIVIQNKFLGVVEEKFLRTIAMEEQFGGKTYNSQKAKDDKKNCEKNRVAINYVYDLDDGDSSNLVIGGGNANEDDSFSDSDSEMDLDMNLDIMSLNAAARSDINRLASTSFDLGPSDFIRYLANEMEEAQQLKVAKVEEEEKEMLKGKKSRRERRSMRNKRYRQASPISYMKSARRSPPNYGEIIRRDKSRSASVSSNEDWKQEGRIEFIRSFGGGGDDDQEGKTKSKFKRLSSPPSKCYDSFDDPSLSLSSRSRRRSSSSHLRYGENYRDRRRFKSDNKYEDNDASFHLEKLNASRRGQYGRSSSPLEPKDKSKNPNVIGTSSTSSSEEDDVSTSRYRSKYRNSRRKNSSGSSSSPTAPDKIMEPQSPPLRRYYGRHLNSGVGRSSSSECDDGDNILMSNQCDSNWLNNVQNGPPNKTVSKNLSYSKNTEFVSTVKDKIRKRMQNQIKRQLKADKKIEADRRAKIEEERINREDEMRETAIKLRRIERERRAAANSHILEEDLSEQESRRSSQDEDRDYSSGRKSYHSFFRSNRSPDYRSRYRSSKHGFRSSKSRYRSSSRERRYSENSRRPRSPRIPKLVDY